MAEPLDAWSRLETQNSGAVGMFQLRILGESPLNLFAVLELPSEKVGIQIDVPARVVPAIRNYPSAAGFRIRAERVQERTKITVLLELPIFRGVFGEMCIDLLRCCLHAAPDEGRAVTDLVDRLTTWKELFSGSGPRPLGEKDQIGLFGELTFVEQMLDSGVPPATVMAGWRGPFSDPHDFHLGQLHVEVKATLAAEASVAWISNLRQLDPGACATLFLWYYRFQTDGGGRTLRALVETLRMRLAAAGAELRSLLDDRLLRSRYLDIHAAEHYDTTELTVSQIRPLRVTAGFPALTRNVVPAAIQEAAYALHLEQVPPAHDVTVADAVGELCTAAGGRS